METHRKFQRKSLFFRLPVFPTRPFEPPSPLRKYSLFWELVLKKGFRQVGKFRTTAKWIPKNGFGKHLGTWWPEWLNGQPSTLPPCGSFEAPPQLRFKKRRASRDRTVKTKDGALKDKWVETWLRNFKLSSVTWKVAERCYSKALSVLLRSF